MPKLTNVSLTGLDFQDVHDSLKNYLRGQSEFQDYDFEGSAMSILVNLLAYNTHYQAYYLNMVANEMFLDSAQTRASVVAAAKSLGYTPTSIRAATAVLDISLVRSAESATTVIDKYTPFSFTQSGTPYTFLVADDATINTTTNTATVTVKEGTKFEYSHVFDSLNNDQAIIIPDDNIDTSTITVSVYDSPESTDRTEYVFYSDFPSLNATSKVYFINENSNGQFEIYFGDNTIGQKPTEGSYIVIEAISTTGAAANGAGSRERTTPLFTIGSSLAGWSSATATVSSPAAGGASKQGIDQIRYLAPLFYETQNRAVTSRDYSAIVKQVYPTNESVQIYGGEDANPPEYGKVFVALKPVSGTTTSSRVKRNIVELLREKNIVTIVPEVVDPEILFCQVETLVSYDPRLTSKTSGTILANVVDEIKNFGDNTLEKFERSLRHSKFVTMIDDVDASISSNTTNVEIYQRITPVLNQSMSYTINFNNELFHPADGYSEAVVTSEPFIHYDSITNQNVTAYIQDNGSGVLQLYRIVNGEKSIFNVNVGTIDYTTGVAVLNNFAPVSIPSVNDFIKVYANIASDDVTSSRNVILQILPEDIAVRVVAQETASNTQILGY